MCGLRFRDFHVFAEDSLYLDSYTLYQAFQNNLINRIQSVDGTMHSPISCIVEIILISSECFLFCGVKVHKLGRREMRSGKKTSC